MAALVAGDEIEFFGEEVDDLALAFVAPLRAQDDEIAHEMQPKALIVAHGCDEATARAAGDILGAGEA
jgi:hypothetical protein